MVGGVLVTSLSWRWIFFVNVPIGLLLLGAAASWLPTTRSVTHAGTGLDLGGALTVTAGLASLVWSLGHAQHSGWGSASVITGLAVAAALLVAFMGLERRALEPLVPFDAFRSRLLTAGGVLSFVSFFPVMAIWYFLTLYLQSGRGLTALEAGLVFVPLTAGVAVGSQLGFRLVSRVDSRGLLGLGAVLAAVGAVWLSRLTPEAGLVRGVIAPAVLVMLGGGLMFAPVTVAATSGVTAERAGLASGLLNATRQVGGALGLAVLATVAASAGGLDTRTGGTAGYAAAFAVAAAAFAATALLGAWLLPGSFHEPDAGGRVQWGSPDHARS